MAGRAKHKQEMAAVSEREPEVRALLESGMTLRQTGEKTGLAFQRLHEWVNKPERAEWWKNLRRMRAAGLAEDSLDVLKKANRESVYVAREQAKGMQWMAERLDPDSWAPKTALAAVQINLGEAFVQAMREANERRNAPIEAESK